MVPPVEQTFLSMKKRLTELFCRRDLDEEVEDIFAEMDRIFRVPRLVGMCPLLVRRQSVKVSYRLCVLNLIFAATTFVLNIVIVGFLRPRTRFSLASEIFFTLELLAYALSPVAALTPLAKLRRLDHCLAGMSSADVLMRKMGLPPNSVAAIRKRYLGRVHCFIVVALISYRMYFIPPSQYFWMLWFYMPNLFVMVLLEQIESTMEALRWRLDGLLVAAKQAVSTTVTFRKIEDLTRCHIFLCRSGASLSAYYSVTFLMITTKFFLIILSEMYSAFNFFRLNNPLYRYDGFRRACWAILTSTSLFRVVSSCARVSRQANEFNALLYHLMTSSQTNEIINNKKLRIHIALNKGIAFTACGLYNMDYSLLHSMAAATMTYFVLLLQCEQQ